MASALRIRKRRRLLNVTQADIDRAEEVRELDYPERPIGERDRANFCPVAQAIRREWKMPSALVTHNGFAAHNSVSRRGKLTLKLQEFVWRWDRGWEVSPGSYWLTFEEVGEENRPCE